MLEKTIIFEWALIQLNFQSISPYSILFYVSIYIKISSVMEID